ncbi:hypothetical protein QUF80_21925 [Desulfococcaceae bacterium HSG8]|nr:hypothetical protein [Desulfococcaceae bacterium HSG8]
MDTRSIKPAASENVVERNIRLTGEVMRYLAEHPRIFGFLPDEFELVILPDDDPEMRLYNLDLLEQYTGEDKAVVFARTKFLRANISETVSVYAPIAA